MNVIQEKLNAMSPVAVLLFATLSQTMIGVFVKYLTETDLTFANQIVLRNLIAGGLGLLIIPSTVKILTKLSLRNKIIVVLRAATYFVAIYLFTLALDHTTLANVGLVSAFPFVTLLGWVIFKEKTDKSQLFLILLALIGVSLVAGVSLGDFSFSKGEVYAFISTGFFGLMYVLAKVGDVKMTNEEYSVATQVAVAPMFLVLSLFNDGASNMTSHLDLETMLFGFGAGTFIIFNMLGIGSAMPRLRSDKANILLYSGTVFSVIASLVFFRDIPKGNEIIGGILILGSVLYMTKKQSDNKPKKRK